MKLQFLLFFFFFFMNLLKLWVRGKSSSVFAMQCDLPRMYSFLLNFTQVLVEDNLPNRLTYFSLKVFLRPIMTHLRGCAKVRSLSVKSKLIFFQDTRFDVFFNTLNLFISMWFSTKLDLFREKLKYAKLSDILSGYSGRQDSTDALWLLSY